MSVITLRKVTCGNCSIEIETLEVKGFSVDVSKFGLDMKPDNNISYIMLNECPQCHYCSYE